MNIKFTAYTKLIATFILLFSGIFARGIADGSRFDLTENLNLGTGQFAQVFVPDYYAAPSNRSIVLVIHMHSASWAAEDMVWSSGVNAVLFNIHLGSFSSSYQSYFQNSEHFQTILNLIRTVLAEYGVVYNCSIDTLIVTSFSAGYAGVREIFKTQSYFDRIDALNLADGLHCNSEPSTRAAQMADFVKFAREATECEGKVMLLTHSSIQTYGYDSTTQTADYLINQLGLIRESFTSTDEIGVQYSRCDSGCFHIRGYLGETATHHLKHLYGMHLMLSDTYHILRMEPLDIIERPVTGIQEYTLINYPNPFNAFTRIEFSLPENGGVTLQVINTRGEVVRTLFSDTLGAGIYTVNWDGTNAQGKTVATGIYLVNLRVGDVVIEGKKIVYLR